MRGASTCSFTSSEEWDPGVRKPWAQGSRGDSIGWKSHGTVLKPAVLKPRNQSTRRAKVGAV